MKVWYVTMIFPAKSETFACSDVRVLRDGAVDVSVHTLRPARPGGQFEKRSFLRSGARRRAAAELLGERGLAGLPTSYGTLASAVRGLGFALRNPLTLLDLISWIARHSWRTPKHLVKSLTLVPRSLDILQSAMRERPDVVHLFWGHYPAIVGYLAHRHLPGTVLSMFLGAYDLERGFAGTAPVARQADVVWTHARANVPAITRLGVSPDRIRVAYRGIDIARFPAHSPKQPRRIVTAGRLIRSKAVGDVIAVFAALLPDFPDARLTVLGNGPERSSLERLTRSLGVAKAVEFLGHVSHDRVSRELATADVFLLMSRKESERLPNGVKEAMACCCVCVVSETPGIEELVVDGETGFVVPQGDIAAASRCVTQVFSNRDDVQKMVAAARTQIVSQFDVRKSMGRYREVWQELCFEPVVSARRDREPSVAC
jgi:glycosyltransferase involved in cell wall biosynthesis